MCGIAGIVDPRNPPELSEQARAMAQALRHRGPDGLGVWSEGGVALGHTRLAVLDLSPEGRQPMAGGEGTIQLVFNGEIYNFQDLRADLEARGFRFRSRSDTEVIVHLYEDAGVEGLRRLDGMFALGLWDGRRRRLVLARDRSGKKPLYHCSMGGRFLFGSEIKALLAVLPEVPPLCEERLPLYLFFGYVPTPDTLYRGIYRFPPASVAELDPDHLDRIEPKPFWRLTFPLSGDSFRESRNAAADHLTLLVTEAVRRRMVADVPVGAFLSGGVDSSIVVGLMSRLSTGPVRTFSIGFRNAPAYDEMRYARVVADRFHTDHTEFRVEANAYDLVERILHHYDEPYGDSSAVPTFIVSRLAREQVTVVLNGDGGDELFAGYPRFPATLLGARLPMGVRRAASRLGRWLPGGARASSRRARLSRFLGKLPYDLMTQFLLYNGMLSIETLASLLRPVWQGDHGLERLLEVYRRRAPAELDRWSPLSRLLFLNHSTYLLDDLLPKMDRMTMAHGLEARSPLLDTAVVEYAASLPGAWKLHGVHTKVLLKEAFSDLLPREIHKRGKMGFGAPVAEWFRGELRAPLEETLLDRGARVWSILNREVGDRLWEEHRLGRRDHALELWSLLMLELWLRKGRRP